MAVTGYNNPNKKKPEELEPAVNRGQTPQQGVGIQGVSNNTQQKVQQYQGYTPSDTVTQAQQQLQQIQASRPGNYQSRYGAQLDSILQQIQNPQNEGYSFANDPQFRYYADLFTQQARQSAQNAAGISAGLTGGYDNSWAQNAANQAYQQNILPLYDRGIDFMNAHNQRQAEQRADQYNQLAAIQGMEDTDYGRYRDTLGDWRQDVAAAQVAEEQAHNRDYGQFSDAQAYWNQLAQEENADYWRGQDYNYQQAQADQAQANWQAQFEYGQQQDALAQQNWQKQFDYQQAQADRALATDYVSAILANGQMPSAELLAMAGLSEEDAQKLMAQLRSSGGSTKKGQAYDFGTLTGMGTGTATKAGVGGRLAAGEGVGLGLWPDEMPTYQDVSMVQQADAAARANGYSGIDEAVAAQNAQNALTVKKNSPAVNKKTEEELLKKYRK